MSIPFDDIQNLPPATMPAELLEAMRAAVRPLVEAEALEYAAEEGIPEAEAAQFAAFCVTAVEYEDESELPWMCGWVRSLAIRTAYDMAEQGGGNVFWRKPD